MEFGNDMIAGMRARIGGRIAGAATPAPDWHGLHARFAAAHAARRELLGANQLRATSFASFDPHAATVLGERHHVNHADLADGKDHCPTSVTRAGEGKTGDKGYT